MLNCSYIEDKISTTFVLSLIVSWAKVSEVIVFVVSLVLSVALKFSGFSKNIFWVGSNIVIPVVEFTRLIENHPSSLWPIA